MAAALLEVTVGCVGGNVSPASRDAGFRAPETDAGMELRRDAGTELADAGSEPLDAGTGVPDAGAPCAPCSEPLTCGGDGVPGVCGNPAFGANAAIATTEQASQRILVFDALLSSWSSADDGAALVWAWAPSKGNGFADPTPGWGLPSDVRLRTSAVHGGEVMLVADSRGFAAVIPYPAGKPRRWAQNLGATANPHAIELLPDGNVAIAASTGGWVRVYAASQSSDSAKFSELALIDAHGVLWDPGMKVLWALGGQALVKLAVGGSAAAPTLRELEREKVPTAGAHDLAPVLGDPDRLWVTTGSHVYQYVKSTQKFVLDYEDAARIDGAAVKSVGSHPVRKEVSFTRVDASNPCTWCTETVTTAGDGGSHTRDGAQFYKARYWTPRYQ